MPFFDFTFYELIMIFPNPFSDIIYLQIEGLEDSRLKVELFDSKGGNFSNFIEKFEDRYRLLCKELPQEKYVIKITDPVSGNIFSEQFIVY